jgi:polygalacturonase/glucan-binding YG repeat protein
MNVLTKRCKKALALVLSAALLLPFTVPGGGIAYAERFLEQGEESPATPSEAGRNQVVVTDLEATPSEALQFISDSIATPSEALVSLAETATPSQAFSLMSTQKRFTRSEGSLDVTGLRVPTLAYDDTSVTLVWDKPENYADVVNYNVYQDGVKVGDAKSNFAQHSDWAATYMKAFYDHYEKEGIDMVNVDIHSFRLTGLTPDTNYDISVIATDASGNEMGNMASIACSTTSKPETFNIRTYGAEPVEKGFISLNEETSSLVVKNTKAIQAAIDDCSEGGKVVIPEGIYMSGALYLKSNMTLELKEGAILFGSPDVSHYDQNYLLYPYSTDTRSWALINTYSADENGGFENIRIVGKGTIYGNGWKYGAGRSVSGDGYEAYYQNQQSGDPDWSLESLKNYALKGWVGRKDKNDMHFGILAKSAYDNGISKGYSDTAAYSTRPNLVVLRNVDGVYIEGITAENPANHTIAVLDSENVVSENVKYITYDANNADGIELGNTQNAMVYNNFFDTGDDAINFATGMGKGVQDTEQKPSSNIWTFNNFLRECHGGAIAAGSHTGAGIDNMLVEDNVLNHSDMPFRFKSAPANGGGINNILIRDCAVGDADRVFTLNTTYSDANQATTVEPADKPAEFYDISAYNITADTISKYTVDIMADVDYDKPFKTWHTHHDLYFQDIKFTNIKPQKNSENIVGASGVVFDNVGLSWSKAEPEAVDEKAWGSIKCSNDITFTGMTTQSVKSYDSMAKPEWPDDTATVASASEAVKANGVHEVSLKWPAAKDGEQVSGKGKVTGYIVETYVGDELVDITQPVTTTSVDLSGLSSDTRYIFMVYAVDAPGNKIVGPRFEITTSAEDETKLKGPASGDVKFSGMGYTWATAELSSAKAADARVRGYRAYVNGDLVSTIYNYQLAEPEKDKVSMTIGRMLEEENEVIIEAFADNNDIFEYKDETVKTIKNYDYHAPVWKSNALSASANGESIKLTWKEPADESGIYGYRVYVDGKPVYTKDGDYFNHVNKAYTTSALSYIVTGLDMKIPHTFRVEAADSWGKALTGTGPYHWTNSGPEITWDGTMGEQLWKSSAFGQSTDMDFKSNMLPNKVGTNYTWPIGSKTPLNQEGKPVQDVVVESRGGKLQTGHDGLTFYYTEVPTNKNFSLTADVTVEQLGPEEGSKANLQEGAGLMVRDVNGSPRKEPLEEGYEEYPAASNMVMLSLQAAGKTLNADINLLAAARYGVNSPAGNLKSVKTTKTFETSVSKADKKYAPADAPFTSNFYGTEAKLRLERTDEGFFVYHLDEQGNVLTSYTFEDKNVTPNIVSHLDQETMYVGFFASRNARMSVRNISLDLSDVVKPDESPDYVAPDNDTASLYIASGAYTNSSEYTVQALTNQSGTMTVSQNGTVLVTKAPVTGGVQFTCPATISGQDGEFKLSFVPSEGADEGKEKTATLKVKKDNYGKELYVSPEGTDEAEGTKEDPMSIKEAINRLVPGGTIYMAEGTYGSFTIPMASSGNKEARKALTAQGSVKVTGSSKIFVLDADYWDVTGLDVDGQKIEGSRGVMIHGSYNVFKDSLIHNTSSDAGLTITKSRGSRSLWPSYNLVENCEAFDNVDGSRINADGFASKSCSGDDNRFLNCVSHDNADDGWDTYNTLADGPNGRTIIENCVAYNNGNNGFKLGGEGREVPHILRNSVAFHNNLDGITDNFNPGELTVEHNTSFDNVRFNYIMRPSPYKKGANGELTADGTVRNNVSFRTAAFSSTLKKVYDDKISAKIIENNYLYQNGTNAVGQENFKSLNPADCFYRKDGRIQFGDFLRPVRGSKIEKAGAGAKLPGIGVDTPDPVDPEPNPNPEPGIDPTPVKPDRDKDSESNRDYAVKTSSNETKGDWEMDQTGWRLKKADGTYPKEEWAKVNGAWYYFGQSGYMSTGWNQVQGVWYYMENSGAMKTDWVLTDGKWYYMNLDGSMAVGWVQVNNRWYYLNQTGECYINTVTPDGYRVNEDGAWING